MLTNFLLSANEFLYTYILIAVLIACGCYFTIRTKFVQFRLLGDCFRQLFPSKNADSSSNSQGRISSVQAFAISLASRVGTGNLAGVAIAIAVGGPGAIFWMWITALLGAASAFMEATLAQLYKRQGSESFIGGPAYYIESGLGSRKLATLSAILIIITFSIGFVSIQCNTIGAAFESEFGWNHLIVGVIVTAIIAFVIVGGVHRIAKVASIIVPFMAIGYLLLAIIVVLLNISQLGEVIQLIIKSAFGLQPATGGLLGTAIMNGIRRGLFSNEAGLGSSPNADATAHVAHPVQQGLIQTLGVFIDTIVVCSCTAFIILLSGADYHTSSGIVLTQIALQSQIGPLGSVFITIALFFFAFSTVISCYYYGEANVRFFTNRKLPLRIFRIFVVCNAMFAFCMSMNTVWELSDLFMGICGLLNLIALVCLSPKVIHALDDYTKQRKQGIATPTMPKWWK